ncbi:hypothetical protein GCM10009527_053470 [Actinomadura nitritigenes]|uniref:Secreted protein n=1 Tax=Actinomadura nitritigenes TaxID=134602 RepID=A0ABS3R9Z5_9ACTN|nr:hypothetical protein [Actinomadura nitritigenes]MBO2443058.1 hypothetical protein [Actinomadura nitritigenes]
MKRFAHRVLPARVLPVLALAAPAVIALGAAPAAADAAPVSFSYADCPDSLPVGADPGNWICDNIVIGGGTMKIGSIQQTLTKPISMTVQSGYDPVTGENINIFVKMRSQQETVPGGVLGVPGTENIPLLSLKEKTQYAGNFSLGFTAAGGYGSTIDLRVKIINSLLGDTCYIGSKTDPIKLNLEGDNDSLKWYDNAIGMTMNDTSFAAPGTTGCGLFGGVANFRAGLPSASGKNAASLQLYLSSKPYTELFPALKAQAKSSASTKMLPLGLPQSIKPGS